MANEFEGKGGSYTIDPESGEQKLVFCTDVTGNNTIEEPAKSAYSGKNKKASKGVNDAAAS